MAKLAKGYGFSDVGLWKICVTLDVPLPPRGYWQKLAAGKTIPKPVLQETTAKTSYVRSMYVVEVDDVLEERVAKARGATPDATNPGTLDYPRPFDPTAFSQQAKLVVRAMKSTKLDEGAFSSLGVTWADISVSADLRERALLLVDRFHMNSKFWAQNLKTPTRLCRHCVAALAANLAASGTALFFMDSATSFVFRNASRRN